MTDYETARRRMVDNQIRTSGVTDYEIIRALLAVPREIFAAEDERPFAYADRELRMSDAAPDRRMMNPVSLSRLVQAVAGGAGRGKILIVGSGTGYSAALLSRLFSEVIALEEIPALAALARERLPAAGAANVSVVEGTLTEGHPAGAPYDAILVDGAIEVLPDALVRQLKPGGLLAVVEQEGRRSRAMLYERVGEEAARRPLFDAWTALLAGFQRPPEFVF